MLRQAWEQSWEPGLLNEYFAHLDTQARSRPHFGLPWTATPEVLPPGDHGWSVKWLVPRPLEQEPGNENTIVVRGNGKEATFAAAANPVLEALRVDGACSLEKLMESSGGTLTKETLRVFVTELVTAGLASIVVNDVPNMGDSTVSGRGL